MNQIIRIIGGKYRGKKLHFPLAEGLRPTPDRVRETLFNWLMNDICGSKCLDAFAGSGAIGFEAYSRGALSVKLLENNSKVYLNLRKEANHFNSPLISIEKNDACKFLIETKEKFNIIFLDPPFAKNYLPICINAIENSDVLEKDGLLYIESGEEININKSVWQELKAKKSGQVIYSLFKKL